MDDFKKLTREEMKKINAGFEGTCTESCGAGANYVSCDSASGDCSRGIDWISCDGKKYTCP
jgi:hypothetical protein